MSRYKQISFDDEDSSIIISDSFDDIRLKFSFTSERLIITQEELSEFIQLLQEFEENAK